MGYRHQNPLVAHCTAAEAVEVPVAVVQIVAEARSSVEEQALKLVAEADPSYCFAVGHPFALDRLGFDDHQAFA